MEKINNKPKRIRSNPVRKWTPAEEKMIINFMLENREFERPTAQHYYKHFIETNPIEIDWKLVRLKVRNMRIAYNKAKAWEGSTGAGSMEGQTFKSTLLKMCGFYDEFEEIFGSRIVECTIINDSLESDFIGFHSTEISEENTTEVTCSPTIAPVENLQNGSIPTTSRRGIYSRTAVSEILMFQNEMMKLKKAKLEHEKEKFREEFKLKERELKLREVEQESQEKLKKLELEMKERLAIEELKLKYKYTQ